MTSTTVAVIVPQRLCDALDSRSESNGYTRSRMAVMLLVDHFGLDIDLPIQGRNITSLKKRAGKEIEAITGQRLIGGRGNVGW